MCLVKFAFAYTYAPLHKFCACLDMSLIFCLFVHIAIRNNHTKFRVNRKIFRYILRRGHFDPPPRIKLRI